MKQLKNATLVALAVLCLASSLTSCATLFGGPVTEYQKRKPMPGEPQRQVRTVALIADILFWPALIVDFATGAIYRPQRGATTTSATPATTSSINQ